MTTITQCFNILAAVEYDGQLSGWAYAILAGMFLLIVGGLSWCFFKAITAASKDASEQLPDEV